jgi:uncharacterized protein
VNLEDKIARVKEILRESSPLLIAYSGGVDSTCLLALAHREVGDGVLGVIADSPSLPRAALAEALEVSKKIGASVEILKTSEFDNEAYLENPPNRCYFCKAELFSQMESLAHRLGYSRIAYGENADDPADLRPGSRAASEFQVIAPLKQAGLTKSDVREISRRLGLPTSDAPAQPCLSSRIPHGTRVTTEALAMIEQGEVALHALGFHILRVRYLDEKPPAARVQIAPQEMPGLQDREPAIRAALQKVGFLRIEIDPDGYQGLGSR